MIVDITFHQIVDADPNNSLSYIFVEVQSELNKSEEIGKKYVHLYL